jgi:hypothetical protein
MQNITRNQRKKNSPPKNNTTTTTNNQAPLSQLSFISLSGHEGRKEAFDFHQPKKTP